jgi:glycosyltransferase involved in cell wall biosynthesis
MRIGVSTRGLNQGSYAISSIVSHLSCKIIELSADRHEIFIYVNDPAYFQLFNEFAHKRSFKLKNRFIWDQVWLPQALKKDRLDMALFMKGTMPLLLPCRGAVIFHDLGYFDDTLRPYSFFETIYMKYMMSHAAKKARHVFTDSEYTRAEALRIFGIDSRNVTVCYQNCSSIFKVIKDQNELESVKARYRLPQKFIFSPISLSPRKNLGRILDAFDRIKNLIPHQIVITGGQSWSHKELIRRITSESNNRIMILRDVPQKYMPALYNLADFTLYPSLLEGFGLPVLEAFRCGCPVLTSNISSIPEVAGEAAYLVDPYDLDQITTGILRLATDDQLCQDLIYRGHEQARMFTWDRTARIILNEIDKHA